MVTVSGFIAEVGDIRRLGIFFPMVLCVLLCGCQALFPGEHTELIKDGKYKPFEDPKKNIEKLMELVEAEDSLFNFSP